MILSGSDSLGRFKFDPGRDNWHGNYRYDSLMNRDWANGLERDRTKESEDLNDNNMLTPENFFRYRIDLGSVTSSPNLSGSHRQKAIASSQETRTTGCLGRLSGQPVYSSSNHHELRCSKRLSCLGSNWANC